MKYLLSVLTHDITETMATEAIESFLDHVSPKPQSVFLHCDNPQEGFCKATRKLWERSSQSPHEFVFWLEHDFRFVREIDLLPLAGVLRRYLYLTQISLMRQAVNEQEKAAGGLYEAHRDDYDLKEGWMEHLICHTTNPSLMRTEFMRENPWPDYRDQCEGRFSGDLRARGFSFGMWGAGEIHVEHIGERTGFGY